MSDRELNILAGLLDELGKLDRPAIVRSLVWLASRHRIDLGYFLAAGAAEKDDAPRRPRRKSSGLDAETLLRNLER